MNTLTITRTLSAAIASLALAGTTFAQPVLAQGNTPDPAPSGAVAVTASPAPHELLPGMLPPQDPRARLDPSLLQLPPATPPAISGEAPAGAMSSAEVGFDVNTGETDVRLGGAMRVQPDGILRSKAGAFAPAFPGEGMQAQKVQGADDRVWTSNTWEYPWRTQCKLIITFPSGNQYVGSGTIVGYKYVLTAGHCTFDPAEGGWARSIEVIPGLSGTYKPYGSFWASYMRSYTGWTQHQDRQHDFALITLNQHIGSTTGWLGYAHYASIWGTTGNLAGYPADLYGGMWQYYHSGPVYDGDLWGRPGQVVHWIDTFGGQSGSGIYKLQDGARYIFAVHAWGNSSINGGTKITSQKFNSIANWIATGY